MLILLFFLTVEAGVPTSVTRATFILTRLLVEGEEVGVVTLDTVVEGVVAQAAVSRVEAVLPVINVVACVVVDLAIDHVVIVREVMVVAIRFTSALVGQLEDMLEFD